MLNSSTVIKNKWKIQSKIGQGAFGETYAGYDLHTGEEVAIKVEKWDNKKMVLKLEVIALKKLQACAHVVRYVHSGRHEDFNYLVMERLGENIAELRKRTPKGAFSLCTTTKLAVQMVDAIEGVHNLGYIHRDIKPSNFVVGREFPKSNRVYLIDFGLARKFRLPSGEIRPPRKSAGFRGTARYASINSHQSKELSRRDDLWSLFYVLVEFALGQLPWRKIKDKEHIGDLKEKYTNVDLVKDLPKEFLLFMEHLQKLGYADPPDYDYLRSLMLQLLSREGYSVETPFDWEARDKRDDKHRAPTREPSVNSLSLLNDAPVISNTRDDADGKTSENDFGNSSAHSRSKNSSMQGLNSGGSSRNASRSKARERVYSTSAPQAGMGSGQIPVPQSSSVQHRNRAQELATNAGGTSADNTPTPDYYNIFNPHNGSPQSPDDHPPVKRPQAPPANSINNSNNTRQANARQSEPGASRSHTRKQAHAEDNDDSPAKTKCRCTIL